ncbi:MAG: ABC transporter permease [Candidatus Marinimicrobia bacterium]|nr:ABC transporter permease [Candidatus Neomarinimicrobiota bacterium]
MDKFLFLFGEGIKNLWRHKLTVFTSVFSIFLVLVVVGVLFIAEQNTQKLIEYMRSKYKIEVFFVDSITDKQAEQIVLEIRKIPGVYSTTLITKDQALQIYQSQFNEDLLEFLDYNPLPSSCVVNIIRKKDGLLHVKPIINKIQSMKGVDSVNHQGRLINRIEKFYEKGLLGLSIVAFAIMLVTVMIISNTIKLTIYSKKDLIQALKMIGATNSFIRMPFILEGIFQSVLGASLAAGLLYGAVFGVNVLLGQLTSFTLHVQWTFLGWLFLIAVVISLFGSSRAISRFVK